MANLNMLAAILSPLQIILLLVVIVIIIAWVIYRRKTM